MSDLATHGQQRSWERHAWPRWQQFILRRPIGWRERGMMRVVNPETGGPMDIKDRIRLWQDRPVDEANAILDYMIQHLEAMGAS
jgi:hypothetical protein